MPKPVGLTPNQTHFVSSNFVPVVPPLGSLFTSRAGRWTRPPGAAGVVGATECAYPSVRPEGKARGPDGCSAPTTVDKHRSRRSQSPPVARRQYIFWRNLGLLWNKTKRAFRSRIKRPDKSCENIDGFLVFIAPPLQQRSPRGQLSQPWINHPPPPNFALQPHALFLLECRSHPPPSNQRVAPSPKLDMSPFSERYETYLQSLTFFPSWSVHIFWRIEYKVFGIIKIWHHVKKINSNCCFLNSVI